MALASGNTRRRYWCLSVRIFRSLLDIGALELGQASRQSGPGRAGTVSPASRVAGQVVAGELEGGAAAAVAFRGFFAALAGSLDGLAVIFQIVQYTGRA